MKRALILSGLVIILFGAAALANSAQTQSPRSDEDPAAVCAAMMGSRGVTAEGRAEMERFMTSGRMAQAMTGMMEMARQMGNGDAVAGMVRMMEMMSMMGRMGSSQMDGLMGSLPTQPAK